MHHAFAIEAEKGEGIEAAEAWIRGHLSDAIEILPLSYGLFSVEDARRVGEVAIQAGSGEGRAIIIAADRAYHEAQNALLKLFEEPPKDVYLFLILPSLGGLLPTMQSRIQVLGTTYQTVSSKHAEEFLKAGREERSAIIKRLTSGKDEERRRELREEAIAIVHGIEARAHKAFLSKRAPAHTALLSDISMLRDQLYDKGAPMKMILEHLALVTPRDLV